MKERNRTFSEWFESNEMLFGHTEWNELDSFFSGFLPEKDFGGETIDHCFSNKRPLFLLFFVLVFFENLGGQTPFREGKIGFGGRPLP